MLQRPGLPEDPRFESNIARLDNRAPFDAIVREVFTGIERDALIERLRNAKIAFGEVNDVGGLARHPALRRGGIGIPGGAIDIVAPPARIDRASRDLGPVPAAGADSEAIRAEFAA